MPATWKSALAPLALALLVPTTACSDADNSAKENGTRDDGTQTLASALAADDDLHSLQAAVERSDLSGVFDGPASYTVLAPDDAAFEALGDEGETLLEADQRPILVAILRDHLLPGHLTPETIGEAIERKGGPVTMTTLGQTEVSFSRSGDDIMVSSGDGTTAQFAGAAIATNNGVIIPIDTVLLPPRQDTAP